jgi:MoxR-like ATPase
MDILPDEALQEKSQEAGARVERLLQSLDRVILDKPDVTRTLVAGVLAGGHVLLEGLPGLGKTELVKGLARLCSIEFRRVQFTPDLLPSDITGSFILQEGDADASGHRHRDFVFQPGPVFCNILLCDEINRASPKTQSALLEAMAERAVTVMGETHRLPDPFFAIATQNPIELEGTYPLPEAQVDRFLFKLHLGRPGAGVLKNIVRERVAGAAPEMEPVLSLDELREAISLSRQVHVSEPVAGYIARLVEATHPDSPEAPDLVKRYGKYGASPRAAIGLGAAARAWALMEGKAHAGFEAVRLLFPHVVNHRILLDYSARMDGVTVDAVIAEILAAVDVTSKALPAGVQG